MKSKVEVEVTCDYCGSKTETFVVNLEHKRFCRIQTPGHPPEKDCLDNYSKEKNYANGKR